MRLSKVTTTALLICGLSLNVGLSTAQRQPVSEGGANVLIDLGNRQRSTGECFLAINLANPNHLLCWRAHRQSARQQRLCDDGA